MLSGGINLIEKGDVWITQVIIGLGTVILNLLGQNRNQYTGVGNGGVVYLK